MSDEMKAMEEMTTVAGSTGAETATEEMPVLVLPGEEEKEMEEAVQLKTVDIEDKIQLTEAEQKVVNDFASKIDISNANHVLQYGADAQTKITQFSDMALQKVRTKDLGAVGDSLTELVVELKSFDPNEDKKGLLGIFKKAGSSITQLKAKYDKAEVNVEKVVDVLEDHQIQLMKDVALLDEMYKLNLTYFKELSMYILAGKRKLEEVRTQQLPPLMEKAQKTGLPEDAQAANDMAAMCNRFEKKLHDLELTRMVSIQMAPQIRLIQNNDTVMTEKIQSTLVNTIPLWKSQMVLSLGLVHSQQAMQAQREVTNMTNELLKKNAEMLKTGTVETAKESERGVVDIETLKQTNETLISTLDEVMRIQDEGRQKRREAESELARIEGELKQKLLTVRN